MRFQLHIDTNNQALTDNDGDSELVRILLGVTAEIDDGQIKGRLRDYNGNVVGRWRLEPGVTS